ncbi:hypothetical protein ABMC88_03560 [Sulfitobacter sp. HNIBRBA2951]|uniref:hypothetical protein n=1 Tax=Sulfitobacter aquimarinus TaxID=3158557 RepID=UPI0032DE9115
MMRLLVVMLAVFWAAAALAQDAVRVGLFGMVEQVAPLVVAGREVAVADGVPVISPLGRGQKLAVGDTVAITAGVMDGTLTAVRILEVYPVVGPVSSVSEGRAVIMGSAVHVPPDVTFKKGRWAALSGFWSGTTVITTNIRRVDGAGFAQLTGAVDPQAFAIGGSTLHGVVPPVDSFGDAPWMISGTAVLDGVQVQLMSKGLFGNGAEVVLWQGHASAPVASQTYMIHGTGVMGTARDAQMPAPGVLVARCAQEGRVLRKAPDGMQAAFDALDCASHIPAD